jgi:hypothetical protein
MSLLQHQVKEIMEAPYSIMQGLVLAVVEPEQRLLE